MPSDRPERPPDLTATDAGVRDSAPPPPPGPLAPEMFPAGGDRLQIFLNIIRGWRLLQSMSLSPGERRDVQNATGGRWDFSAIIEALHQLHGDEYQGKGAKGKGKGAPVWQGKGG